MVLFGAGLGLTSPVVTTALQNAVDIGDLGIATALNMFFRSLGGALGVAVFGSILNNRLGRELAKREPAGTVGRPKDLLQAPKAIRAMPAALRNDVISAVAHTLHAVFLWATPIGCVGLIFALFLRELPLRQHSAIDPGSVPPAH
jgi:hypothetical protein